MHTGDHSTLQSEQIIASIPCFLVLVSVFFVVVVFVMVIFVVVFIMMLCGYKHKNTQTDIAT